MKIRVKKEFLSDYKTKGYVENELGYNVKAKENCGIFVKEFGYIILHGEYEVVE